MARIELVNARKLVIDRALEPLTTAELAALVGYSVDHFPRLFREAFGETPFALRTRRRIDEAERLLARGWHASDVCLEVGFESLASFSHLFLRHTGYRPTEFRRVFSVDDRWTLRRIPACFLSRFSISPTR